MQSSNNIASIDKRVFEVGTDQQGKKVVWGPELSTNFNALFQGESGSGKTFTIQQTIARVYNACRPTVHIFDTKGDFTAAEFEKSGLAGYIGEYDLRTLDFSYVEGNSSVDIFRFSTVKEAGGVYMAIQDILVVLKLFNPQFSSKMNGYMQVMLEELYKRFDINHDDEESWQNKTPSVNDLLDYINEIILSLKTGLNKTVFDKVYTIRKKIDRMKIDSDAMAVAGSETLNMDAKIEEEKNKLKDEIGNMVDELIDPVNCFFSGWKEETLMAIRDTVYKMVKSHLFTRGHCRREKHKVNHYILSGISPDHQQLIMYVLMRQVYGMGVAQAASTGSYNPKQPTHIIVADEGKHAKEMAKSPMSPLNRIATEGRGYGLGLYTGVQSPDQLTLDTINNFGTRFITKTSEGAHKDVQKYFGVSIALMKRLKARENCLFGVGGKYELIQQYR